MRRTPLVLILLLHASPLLAAEEAPAPNLATDRPGNGNAATVVDKGYIQLETSLALAVSDLSDSDRYRIALPTLFRLGATPRFEFRLGTGIIGIDTTGSGSSAESTDTSVGFKVSALAGDGLIPDIAFSADLFMPSGSGAFASGGIVFDGRLTMAFGLPAGLGLLFNAGAILPDADGAESQFLYVANLGFTPPLWGERLSLFVEGFGLIPFDGGDAVQQVDAGLAWKLTDTTQIDAFTQHGLSDAADDLQVAAGFSIVF